MAAKTERVHHTIHWFRKGLRLHDNQSLREACETSLTLRPVYFIDPDYVKHGNMGFNRWRFLIQSLNDLDNNLKTLGSRLFVVQGKPELELPRLFKAWKITKLTFEFDHEPDGRQRDTKICELASEAGIEVETRVCHSLYDLDKIIEKNGGAAPLTYKKLCSVVSSMGPPLKPLPAVDEQMFDSCSTPFDDKNEYQLPMLEELGIKMPEESSTVLFPGGETEALRRLDEHMEKEDWVCKFEKPNTAPNSLQPSTTVLSPYVMFGCLSARLFYHRLSEVYSRAKKHSNPPVSLHGQLLWREFFFTAAYATPNFNKMEGNPVCLQVPWDINPEFVKAWSEARTGYPFIDAIMTQLRREGWIHHLARHAVACFLTRGDLWISWEEGLKLGGRIIRVDHCANYRRPKGDEKDENINRKEIVEEGCAPKTPSPSPPASDEEEELLELPKKRKKEKKAKKQKKHKEEKTQKKKKTTVSSGDEDPAEKRKKLEKEPWREKAPGRPSQTDKDKRDRTDRDVQRDSDSQNLKVTRDNKRDRWERDFGDGQASRDVHERRRDPEVINHVHDIRERDKETRDRDVHERDRETSLRDYRERDAGGASDRHKHNYHSTYKPREQRDRAYHRSRHDRDREVDDKRKDRFDKRRDYSDHKSRTYERRDRR